MSSERWPQRDMATSDGVSHIRGADRVVITPDEYASRFPQPPLDKIYTRGRFQDKVAIVAGGASGIGRAVVERFSNDSAGVAIFDIDEQLGNGLQRELHAHGAKARFYKVDISNKKSCEDGVEQVMRDFGAVHFLVNSVFFTDRQEIDEPTTVETWKATLSVNLIGYSNMAQACSSFMKRGEGCAIVNVSSVRALRAVWPTRWAYSTSKAAVGCLSRCQALDYAEKGIRVNTVSPGLVWTPAVHSIARLSRESSEKFANSRQLVEGLVESADIASVITFLCSQDARFIDGVDIPIDGGSTIMGPGGKENR